MEFNIGDRIKYSNTNENGGYLLGEVVDIWKNSSEIITGYFAILESGEFVQIQPDSARWCKLEEPVLIT
jgi:hypothetical protein